MKPRHYVANLCAFVDASITASRTTLNWEFTACLSMLKLILLTNQLVTELTVDKSTSTVKVDVILQLTVVQCAATTVWTFHLRM